MDDGWRHPDIQALCCHSIRRPSSARRGGADCSFVQISDSHIGFNKAANQDVIGTLKLAIAGYPYSTALKKARIVWNEASLERWLAEPDTLVPGNNMEFHVPKPQERRDLIRVLDQGALK